MSTRKPLSTNNTNREELVSFCGLSYAMDILSGRWKFLILYKLNKETLRYSELKKQLPNVTDRMLSLHLKELERDGLIIRTLYPRIPPYVDYRLSEIASRLVPVWQELESWGHAHKIHKTVLPSS
jgi:DNA-binding HxlR family transcriptional regulator